MKTNTALKAGTMPLSKCRNVNVSAHNRGNTAGKKVTASCPFHGLWADVGGWFPANQTVVYDDSGSPRLTASGGGHPSPGPILL